MDDKDVEPVAFVMDQLTAKSFSLGENSFI